MTVSKYYSVAWRGKRKCYKNGKRTTCKRKPAAATTIPKDGVHKEFGLFGTKTGCYHNGRKTRCTKRQKKELEEVAEEAKRDFFF